MPLPAVPTTTTEDEKPRLIVLGVRAKPEHREFVVTMLKAVRSGLAANYLRDDEQWAWDFYGPFVVDDVDEAIVDSLADEYEGYDQGAKSDREPDIVRNRQIRYVARLGAQGALAAGNGG